MMEDLEKKAIERIKMAWQNGKNCMTDKNSEGEVTGMRTREMSISNYNIPDSDYKKLLDYCRNMDVDDRLRLFQSAISAAPGLELPVYESLVTRVGYRTIIKQGRHIPAKEDDFYAYRRKTLATFYDRLRLFGRWKD